MSCTGSSRACRVFPRRPCSRRRRRRLPRSFPRSASPFRPARTSGQSCSPASMCCSGHLTQRSSGRRSGFPATTTRSPSESTPPLSRRTRSEKLIVVELAPGQTPVARAVLQLLPTLPGFEVVLARTAPLTRRPTIPAAVRTRARTRSLIKPEPRLATLSAAAIFVPAPGGSARLLLEAKSCGCAIADPAGLTELALDDGLLAERRRQLAPRRPGPTSIGSPNSSSGSTSAQRGGAAHRRSGRSSTTIRSATATGSWSISTCTPTARTTARSSRRH